MTSHIETEKVHFHGLPAIQITHTSGARAVVTEAGAHLVSWKPAGGPEQLYLSPISVFQPGVAIRGGVPVIFPQFSTRGTGARHGFARVRGWELQDPADTPAETVVLTLSGLGTPACDWIHPFACALSIVLEADRIAVRLEVHNTGDQCFDFTAALHTYLRVESLDKVRIVGLQGTLYEDAQSPATRNTETSASVCPQGLFDRIYYQTADTLHLEGAQEALRLESTGFTDTVVWNPGAQACAALADMPADGWQQFVCIEAATIGTPVTLEPGQRWSGEQRLIRALRPHPAPHI